MKQLFNESVVSYTNEAEGRAPLPTESLQEFKAELFRALAHPTRIRLLEQFLAEGHGPRVRATRRQLRTMQPGDTYYKNWLHYVTVMPGTLRRCRRELARLRRAVAKRDAQRGQDR
mgnify:CR=1 FL=1